MLITRKNFVFFKYLPVQEQSCCSWWVITVFILKLNIWYRLTNSWQLATHSFTCVPRSFYVELAVTVPSKASNKHTRFKQAYMSPMSQKQILCIWENFLSLKRAQSFLPLNFHVSESSPSSRKKVWCHNPGKIRKNTNKKNDWRVTYLKTWLDVQGADYDVPTLN